MTVVKKVTVMVVVEMVMMKVGVNGIMVMLCVSVRLLLPC